MTHAILNASLRYVPIWLDEGLAKYFETPRGDRATQNPFLDQLNQMQWNNPLMPPPMPGGSNQ